MTYKAIVKELIKMEAMGWLENLMKEHGIDFMWTCGTVTEMENDKQSDSILWTVEVGVTLPGYEKVTVKVGGTSDDLIPVCCSVIQDKGHNILWMASPSTRENLGIEKFKIA